jgi:SAM-dependent methyltransferase
VNRAEWNDIADAFEDSVCDVAVDETNDQLRRFVNAARPSPKSSVLVDLGCGIGSFIQKFGHRFKEIVGVEYAPRIIARAKERCAGVDGVEWLNMDAARAARNGHALFVLPSLESEEMLQRQSLRDARNQKFEITADGLVETEGSFQKHYRQDEVIAVASGQGFEVKRIARIRSAWSRTGLRKPRGGEWEDPWDWICLARKLVHA